MNILHITNELNFSDGVSTHLFYLLKELKNKKGINIHLLCGGGDAVEKFTDIEIEPIVNKNFLHSKRSLKNFAEAILNLRAFLRKNEIKIVHSHNHYAANISLKSKSTGIKTIQTLHGIIPGKGTLKHFAADYYIAVSDFVFEYVQSKINITPDKICVILNGIETEDNVKKIYGNKLKFIAASRLEEGKGIETFIKAVSMLPENEKFQNEFMVAGEGSLENKLKQLNVDTGAEVKFTGMIKNLSAVLKQTDVFVITSESEGLPMTMLEAGAQKNIIISSDFRGAEKIINPSTEGLMFRIKDHKELAEKISYIISNRNYMQTASENFYRRVRDFYNSKIMSDRHLEFYNEIVRK